MIALLGGTTLAAAWMTRARQPAYAPAQADQRFGRFALALPGGWARRHRPADAADRFRARLTDGSRLLDIVELGGDRLVTPDAIVREAARELCPATTWFADVIRMQRGPLTARLIVGNAMASVDGQTRLSKDLLAVATVDGETYLGLHLSGMGRIQRGDVDVMQRLIMTVEDRYYTTLPSPRVATRGVALRRPPQTAMLIRADGDADDAVWFVPGRSEVFYRVEVRALSIEELRRRWKRYGVAGAEEADRASLLAATLQATHYSATGRRPSRREVERGRIAGRSVLRLGMANLRQHQGHHERWAVELGPDHVLLMDLVSDGRSLQAMAAAARHIVEQAQTHTETTDS